MLTRYMIASQNFINFFRGLDFLAPLAIRLYLAPVLWMAGSNKWTHIESTAAWFGNPDWGLGLPYPTLMAYMASATEMLGAVFLLIGLMTRWISVPLMVVMLVAIFAVHWDAGWAAIANDSAEASARLAGLMDWLQQAHPERYEFITELGSPVILNNGIEFAVTYFIMLLTLFFVGAGRYASVDYYVDRYLSKQR